MMLSNGCPRLVVSAPSRSLGRSARLLQTLPSQRTITAFATQRNLGRQIPSTRRHISLLPWRRDSKQKDLPFYFSDPVANEYRRKARWQVITRLVFTGLVFYICAHIYIALVIDPLSDWLEQEYEALSEEDKDQIAKESEEDGGDLLFLPFPFTKKLVQEPPYRSSDPEWAMFLKVNKDRKLQREIKDSVAEILRRQLSVDPRFIKIFGGSNITVRRMWLDIIYPPSPPPLVYVSGFIIAEDGLYWGDREMHPAAGSRLDRVLEPKAAALGTWAFMTTLFAHTVRDISGFMGFKQSQEPTEDTSWQATAMKRMLDQSAAGATKDQSRVTAKVAERLQSDHLHHRKSEIDLPTDDASHVDSPVQAATMAAARAFAKAHKPMEQPAPRGSIHVDGMLEIQGPNANVAFFVRARYDPVRRQYVSINTTVKHVLNHKQTPAT